MEGNNPKERIPVSVSLNPTLDSENVRPQSISNKKRILYITGLAVIIAVCISFIAKFLLYLIHLITNIFFFGEFSLEETSPADNELGLFVILVPVIGGLVVGLMIYFGSKEIRGHGIPEAMEKILINKSRIHPAITFLKPLSSAVAIGTGGPFGAEGPIIATGGALGSTFGQIMKISQNERKILLAAGAAAGMSAIFGSPIAAIFLSIELLLFEFSPRSIIPVALACVTGAAGHHFLFETGPFFEMDNIAIPSNWALFLYSILGIVIGVLSVGVSKAVYLVEDYFEKLPIHFMWWPAIGGIAVGVIGYFAPKTLGVGYDNISDLLMGSLSLQVILSLCILKFISWAIALGSGTAGGTLAPLLIIGGATGSLMGSLFLFLFPEMDISLPLAALLGMSAMFAGASRAVLTSIVFAVETTGEANALLPLLAASVASYLVSFILMKNTIMTEKIERRGVRVPDSYESDALGKIRVEQVIEESSFVLSEESSLKEAREWLNQNEEYKSNYYIISGESGEYKGIISSSSLYSTHHEEEAPVSALVKRKNISIYKKDNLRTAVQRMAVENIDVLPVVESQDGKEQIIGVLSYQDILSTYKDEMEENKQMQPHYSFGRNRLSILLKGKRMVTKKERDKKD
ncbi:MAG TPA: chloride channel protein [Salinimicrobium sp.]|nr:chloride channel protein [Salinimicrobium sp.]